MKRSFRMPVFALGELVATWAPFVLLGLVLLGVAYWWLDPTPPHRVVLATGQPQGAYAAFGRRYAEILRRNGVTVELRETAGAAENLALLTEPDGPVDIAFLQGGASPMADAAQERPDARLESLGSLFHEPLWLFYREDAAERRTGQKKLTGLEQLAGWRVNIGSPGSGSPNLMRRLFDAVRLDPQAMTLLEEGQTPSTQALLEGRSDAIVFASAPESLLVQMLLQSPGIALFDFAESEAYARRFPFLTPVVLPRGVVDLARHIPADDVRLVAPTAVLVARERLHPALVQLFVQAAAEVHGGAGWFQRKGDFPSARNTERPLAADAERYYRTGPPALQRYLPFWLANLVDRMWPVILAIVAVMIPLSRVLPPLYTFQVRSRIFRWYRQLREIESAIGRRPDAELLAELAELERLVEGISVPLSYADELYALRSHIQLVAERLVGGVATSAATAAAPAVHGASR